MGKTIGDGGDVVLTRDTLSRHALVTGVSGTGKTNFMRRLAGGFLELNARGDCDDLVVVFDAAGDLTAGLLADLPSELLDRVRVLDFGGERLPDLNLLDPRLYFDADWCAKAVTDGLRTASSAWGARLEDVFSFGLRAICEYNSHRDTGVDEMLTLLDLPRLLDSNVAVGDGRVLQDDRSEFQQLVMSRVSDYNVLRWFDGMWKWPSGSRREMTGSVWARLDIGGHGHRGTAVLGQWRTSEDLVDLFGVGGVVLVSFGGPGMSRTLRSFLSAALMGMYTGALRWGFDRGMERRPSFLFADEVGAIPGGCWEEVLSEYRKYGCSAVLSTSLLDGLQGGEQVLLPNVGCLVSFRSSPWDASTLCRCLRGPVSESDLLGLDSGCGYLMLSDGYQAHPASLVRFAPPSGGDVILGEYRALVAPLVAGYTRDCRELATAVGERLSLAGS